MTTSNTYYYQTIGSEPQRTATILQAADPAATWADVIKVGFRGEIYRLTQHVVINNDIVVKIVAFESTEVTVLRAGSKGLIKYTYDKIRPLAGDAAAEAKPEPNRAFKHRKRKGKY